MNICIITASGIGSRMNSEIPKQFIKIKGKSVLIYTIENTKKCKDINHIVLVCHKDYMEDMKKELIDLNLFNNISIIPGGETSQESIQKGIAKAKEISKSDEDIIIIQDGVRPLCPPEAFDLPIKIAKKANLCISYRPMIHAVVETEFSKEFDCLCSNKLCGKDGRSDIVIDHTPHCIKLKTLNQLYEEAKNRGFDDFVASDILAVQLGRKIYYAKTSPLNFKITEPEDLELVKAMIEYQSNK